MPAVIDTPELIDTEQIEIHNLTIEQPPVRKARPGFWRMLTRGISGHLPPTPHEQHAPACYNELRRFEAPMDRFVREYPSLAPYALAII